MTDESAEAWLHHVATQTWLTWAPLQYVRPSRAADGVWRFGAVEASEDALIRARPPGDLADIFAFNLVHQAWRVAPFRLFRPVVYFAAFGAQRSSSVWSSPSSR
jgi:hypothetical protein